MLFRSAKELSWATSIVFGPGIGISSATELLMDLVLKHATVPVVIDADGLNMLKDKSEYVKKDADNVPYFELPANVVLTPHLKEMANLLSCEVEDVKSHLLPIVKHLTKKKQFVLALKDARTIVGTEDSYYINVSGNNGMATGGSGDVLTGVIAGLVANGMPIYEAACLGVYVHGLAGDKAREEKGAYGLIATDIIESLPSILN